MESLSIFLVSSCLKMQRMTGWESKHETSKSKLLSLYAQLKKQVKKFLCTLKFLLPFHSGMLCVTVQSKKDPNNKNRKLLNQNTRNKKATRRRQKAKILKQKYKTKCGTTK